MTGLAALFGSAFLLSLAGAAHCAGMCGAFAVISRSAPSWHAGKAVSYAALGAIAGGASGQLSGVLGSRWATVGVAVAASIVLVHAALQLAGFARSTGRTRLGRTLSRSLTALVAPSVRALPLRRFAFGVVNGLVPCGMVYAGLAVAAVAGSAGAGAVVMLGFAVGTMPVLVAVGLGAERARRLSIGLAARRAAALAVLVVGLCSVWTRTPLGEHDGAPACHQEHP